MNGIDFDSPQSARILNVGWPGGGKTGSIVSLINAGFKVRMLAFEANYKVLKFADPVLLRENVDLVVLQDKMTMGDRYMEPVGVPTAIADAARLMKEWKYTRPDGTVVDHGKSREWGPDTVVVVDSLTSMGQASMRRQMKLSNQTLGSRTSNTWGAAVDEVNGMIELMARDEMGYHLIVLGHLQMIGPEDYLKQGDSKEVKEVKLENIQADLIPTKLFPVGVTKNQSTRIAKEFDTMVLSERAMRLGKMTRVIRTVGNPSLDLKVPAKLKDEYPVETGMLDIFKALGFEPPKE